MNVYKLGELAKNSTSLEKQSVYGLKKEKSKSQKQMVDIYMRI